MATTKDRREERKTHISTKTLNNFTYRTQLERQE